LVNLQNLKKREEMRSLGTMENVHREEPTEFHFVSVRFSGKINIKKVCVAFFLFTFVFVFFYMIKK